MPALSSIIVGEYTAITSNYQGIPIMTNVYPHEVNEGKITSARLTEMVKFFSEKTGVKYLMRNMHKPWSGISEEAWKISVPPLRRTT